MSTQAVMTLFQHLHHFAEAVGADPAVPANVQTDAKALRHTPPRGPIAQCGHITNTDKHSGRDQDKTSAVLAHVGAQTGDVFPSTFQHSMQVTFTDRNGVEWPEDGLGLAEAAFETWRAFLVTNHLSAS